MFFTEDRMKERPPLATLDHCAVHTKRVAMPMPIRRDTLFLAAKTRALRFYDNTFRILTVGNHSSQAAEDARAGTYTLAACIPYVSCASLCAAT